MHMYVIVVLQYANQAYVLGAALSKKVTIVGAETSGAANIHVS